jgi:hypothetical protein
MTFRFPYKLNPRTDRIELVLEGTGNFNDEHKIVTIVEVDECGDVISAFGPFDATEFACMETRD